MPYAKVADWFYKADLEALYEGCDLTYAQIAEPLGVSARTVYNWVTGETRPKSGMVRLFAGACGASEKRIEFLVHVVSQLDSGSLVSDLDKRNLFIVERAEATAGEIWKFEPWYIHGPLQLLRYHMDLLPGHEDSMQNWQRKYKRYLVLSKRHPAPIMRFLTTTNALRQFRGWEGAEEQFNHLLEVDSWPNCEIRILDGLHYGVEHAFDIFQPGGFLKAPPPLVYVETMDQARHIEEVPKVNLYDGQVKRMWSAGQRIGGRLDDWIQ